MVTHKWLNCIYWNPRCNVQCPGTCGALTIWWLTSDHFLLPYICIMRLQFDTAQVHYFHSVSVSLSYLCKDRLSFVPVQPVRVIAHTFLETKPDLPSTKHFSSKRTDRSDSNNTRSGLNFSISEVTIGHNTEVWGWGLICGNRNSVTKFIPWSILMYHRSTRFRTSRCDISA